MNLQKLSLGQRIIAGSGILLIFDLVVLPWHRIDLGAIGGTLTRSAIEAPNGGLGLLALLAALVVVAYVALSAFTEVAMPVLPVSWAQAQLAGAAATAAFVFLKLAVETSALGIGAWAGVILAAAVVYGGYIRYREMEATAGAQPPVTNPTIDNRTEAPPAPA